MGIKGLGKFLSEHAPSSVRQLDIKSLMGCAVAIDASMSLYQFMIAIRDGENFGNLTNEAGEVTSHISGFLARVVKLLENGVKPVYVFDGKPTQLKSGELAKRRERRDQAEMDLEEAKDVGDKEEIKKFMGRTVRITQQHNSDVRELLNLLGVPIIEAPTEAEAQCAKMTADGLVSATATEDADALTFGTPVLIRHLNFSDQKQKGKPIIQITLENALNELNFTMDQFIDFCILCGCDYCDRLKGIGPNTAYKLIKQHKTLDSVIDSIDKNQHPIPQTYAYKEAREFFQQPEVLPSESLPKLIWRDVNEEELKKFLVERNSFNATRVDAYINRLRNAKRKSSQTRLENFFGPVKVVPKATPKAKSNAKTGGGVKRKSMLASSNGNKKPRTK